MEIRPVKNYKKPNYAVGLAAVMACVSTVSGCSLSGDVPLVGDGTSGSSASSTVPTETMLMGTEYLREDGAVAVETTSEEVVLAGDTMLNDVVAPIEFTDDLPASSTVPAEAMLISEETTSEEATPSDDDALVVLDGDVTFVPDPLSVNVEAVFAGLYDAGVGDIRTEYDAVEYNGVSAGVMLWSEDLRLIFSFYESYNGCEKDGSICSILGDRTGCGLADKFGFGYIDTVNYNDDEHTIVFIDIAAHTELDGGDVSEIVGELKSRGII